MPIVSGAAARYLPERATGLAGRTSAFFSEADVKELPFRLSLNVCFRPEGDIRIFLKTVHKDQIYGDLSQKSGLRAYALLLNL